MAALILLNAKTHFLAVFHQNPALDPTAFCQPCKKTAGFFIPLTDKNRLEFSMEKSTHAGYSAILTTNQPFVLKTRLKSVRIELKPQSAENIHLTA